MCRATCFQISILLLSIIGCDILAKTPDVLAYQATKLIQRNENLQDALSMVQKASDKGNPSGLCILGDMYYEGIAVSKDYNKAFELRLKAAGKGHPAAQLLIGNMYANGDGVPMNTDKAEEWWNRAIEECNVNVISFLSIGKDFDKAFAWISKKAEQGEPKAEFVLGIMYHNNWGANKNSQKINWLEKAANDSDSNAQCILGTWSLNSSQDKEAIALLLKSAEQGNANAQYRLGMHATNQSEKIKWLQKAAEQGFPSAQLYLARLYDLSLHNTEQALKWYQKAAESGDVYGQYDLGKFYYDQKNIDRATEWWTKASSQGHDEAQRRLDEVKR